MAVFRVEKSKNYTTMSNYHLRDKRMSLKAKGLLSLILSLPEDWDYSVRGLAAICKESPDGIATPLRELEKCGYLFREQTRDRQGRLGRVEYVIFEQPQDALPRDEKPCTEKPCTAKPDTVNPDTEMPPSGKPCTETPAQRKKEELTTDEEKTERKNHLSNPQRTQAAADRMKIERDQFRTQIKSNIHYDTFHADPWSAEEVEELVELLTDAVCMGEPFLRIAGSEIPTAAVRERMLKLNEDHIRYVLDCLKENDTKIYNIRQYLLTALFNAPVTMNHYYAAEVKHDLRGG